MPKGQNGDNCNWKAKGHCVICGWREDVEMYSRQRNKGTQFSHKNNLSHAD